MTTDEGMLVARENAPVLPDARAVHGWGVVAASLLGLIVAQGPINAFASALFLKPVTESLSISRGTFSSGLLLSTVLSAVAGPLVGRLIDRAGIRPVLLSGIVMFAIATAAMAMLQSSHFVFYALFALSGLMGAVQLPTGYAKAIAQWFDRRRGLALGIGTAGAGLGVALVPQLAARLIQEYGWRTAYIGLGIAVIAAAFAPAAAFIREPARPDDNHDARRSGLMPASGLTASEAARTSWCFWALMISFLLAVIAVNGTLTHIVALLTDRGATVQAATAALSIAGMAVIGGRVVSGFLLDKLFGPYVALCFLACPIVGIALLAAGVAGQPAIFGGALCGVGIGAEIDLMAFLISRYLGLKAFGEIYGYAMCILTAGSGLGTFAMGQSFDHWHSYRPALVMFVLALVAAAVVIARLGPYRFPATAPAEAAQ